jgi:hypothetical protein
MSKSIKVATAVAANVKPTAHDIGVAAFTASQGGKVAAAQARTLWGAEWPTLKPNSVERQDFNAGALAAWMTKYRERVPTAVRKMGEYHAAATGETVPEGCGTDLTPAFVMGYAGNALTKLKKENPTLGALVATQKKKYQDVCADAWRNMAESYGRLLKDEAGEDGSATPKRMDPFGVRLPKYVERIITANNAAFERGDTSSYSPDVMDKAAAAFAKVLKDNANK